MAVHTGRHFLQIPGPTNVPDRVLRAIDSPTIDHRGPEFAVLGLEVLAAIKTIFQTRNPVIIFPASGTGAWESALVNVLESGDRVLMCETGQFSTLWSQLAGRLGIEVEMIPGDWRSGADPAKIEERLTADKAHEIKALCVVHNETSTGSLSRIKQIRAAIDRAAHPALFMVDTISSLGSADYRHDEWGVDVTVSGSQKGLMLPPGLSFVAVSDRAIAISEHGGMPRSYWRWDEMIAQNAKGYFPYTPATNLLYGLKEAIAMLHEEGLNNVFARHRRHGAATRRAVAAWGLDNLCSNPDDFSPVLTAVRMPNGQGADALRKVILDHFDMSLGAGLGKVADKVFRIGHLGHFNDLTLAGTLSGVEMGLRLIGMDNAKGGVVAALEYLADETSA
tara:strand:- start:395 stop:1570 length:1176 start_codon:yes stop_codon:yes gene_type:complete